MLLFLGKAFLNEVEIFGGAYLFPNATLFPAVEWVAEAFWHWLHSDRPFKFETSSNTSILGSTDNYEVDIVTTPGGRVK